jgi:large subunit ribosomal protein L28
MVVSAGRLRVILWPQRFSDLTCGQLWHIPCQQFYRGAYGTAINGALIMAKRCQLTGKSVMSGNNVSHANNRTRRRFLPNLQSTSMQSEILNRKVSLRVSTSAMRTVEKHGGLDAFLLQARNAELADEAQQLKREIVAAQAASS